MKKYMLLVEELFVKPLILYRGTKSDFEEDSPYPADRKIVFFSDSPNQAKIYGRNVFQCSVNVGNMADLTDSNSQAHKDVIRMFSKMVEGRLPQRKKTLAQIIELGEVWKNKPLEKKIFAFLFGKGYDSICLYDLHSEDFENDADFSVTYVVKNNNNIFVNHRVHGLLT